MVNRVGDRGANICNFLTNKPYSNRSNFHKSCSTNLNSSSTQDLVLVCWRTSLISPELIARKQVTISFRASNLWAILHMVGGPPIGCCQSWEYSLHSPTTPVTSAGRGCSVIRANAITSAVAPSAVVGAAAAHATIVTSTSGRLWPVCWVYKNF